MIAERPDHIAKIVRFAAAAPSGDNSQPWEFAYRAPDIVEIKGLPELDHPILNVDSSGTLVALGAAVENASIAAGALGYATDVSVTRLDDCVAVLRLSASPEGVPADASPLYAAIPERHSNRKPFRREPLDAWHRLALMDAGRPIGAVSADIVEERSAMLALARAMVVMEEVALTNQALHSLFFKSIFWSESENMNGKSGLYIKTMELPPPAQALFKVLPSWKAAKILAKLGLPKLVASTNAAQIGSAAGFVVIRATSSGPQSYFDAGRLLERIWLKATSIGLSFQVVTGTLFLARSVESGSAGGTFGLSEAGRILAAREEIKSIVGGTGDPIISARFGFGPPPTAVSYRRDPVITEF